MPEIDNHDLRATLRAIYSGELTAGEAKAVLDIARRAAAADKKTDIAEMTMLLRIKDLVTQMADEVALSVSGHVDPIDLSKLSAGACELAFACAYLVMGQDLAVVAEERAIAAALATELRIDDARAAELIAMIDQLVRTTR